MSASLDPAFPAFRAALLACFPAVAEAEVAGGFMRAEALRLEPLPMAPRPPGLTRVAIQVGPTACAMDVAPRHIAELVGSWERELELYADADWETFTRASIAYVVAINRHAGPLGLMLISAVLWLAAADAELLARIVRGDVTLRFAIDLDPEARRPTERLGLTADHLTLIEDN